MITPYRFLLEQPNASEVSQWYDSSIQTSKIQIQAINEVIDLEAGTRKITLEIKHPGLIWTVIAFTAEVLEWDLPSPPPKGIQRHHIKEVSRFGRDTWSVDLLIKLDSEALAALKSRDQGTDFGKLIRIDEKDEESIEKVEKQRDPSRLWIDFSGMDENGFWPQKAVSGEGQRNIQNFKKMDEYLQRQHPEVDVMMLGIVGGVAVC